MSWGRDIRGFNKLNGQFITLEVVQGAGRKKGPNNLVDEKTLGKGKTLKTSKESNKHVEKYETMSTLEKILVRIDTS